MTNPRERALVALKQRGCTVSIDESGNVSSIYASDLKIAPSEVDNFAAFPEIRELTLADCAHDDSIWPVLAQIPELLELTLWAGFGNDTKGPADIDIAGFEDPPVWRMGVSDNGSEFLRFVPKLKLLDLRCSPIGDATLARVGGLKSLEKLVLLGTCLTGAGLAHLRGLNDLKELCLVQTAADDDGIESISELQNLTELELETTEITDAGLVHIRKLTALELLSIHDTAATEQGLLHLQSLKQLRTLYVGSPITGVGASYLKELTSLRYLYIGTSTLGRTMSDQEMGWLQSQLPDAIVA